MIWVALDAAIYSALLAAWHYKWAAQISVPGIAPRDGVSYRPRPIEADYRVSVLFNRQVNDTGSGDDGAGSSTTPRAVEHRVVGSLTEVGGSIRPQLLRQQREDHHVPALSLDLLP